MNVGVQPERGPDRPAPQEDPAKSERDRDPRPERDDGLLERLAGAAPRDRQHVGEGEDERRLDDAAPRADAFAQAVVANPRKNSSSPNGARIAPASSVSANPTALPVGGSGLTGVTGKSDLEDRDDRDGDDDDRDRPQRAAGDLAERGPPSRRTPISAQLSAPVSTTSSRMSRT